MNDNIHRNVKFKEYKLNSEDNKRTLSKMLKMHFLINMVFVQGKIRYWGVVYLFFGLRAPYVFISGNCIVFLDADILLREPVYNAIFRAIKLCFFSY